MTHGTEKLIVPHFFDPLRSLRLVAPLCLACAWSAISEAATQETQRLSLNGEWSFALDPFDVGVEYGWHAPDPDAIEDGWDQAIVPHAWPTEPRYDHTGTAWYRRAFTIPAAWRDRHLRLAFGAVFQHARVWVNGEPVGEHEGGYTPFALDITENVQSGRENTISVAVNNAWDRTTIPGARPGHSPNQQVYPWWNYGGIVRDVSVLATPPLFVEKVKVVADPDLQEGSAELDVAVWVANASDQPRDVTVGLEVRSDGEEAVLRGWQGDPGLRGTIEVPARSVQALRLRSRLGREQVELWHPDSPNLYQLRAVLWDGTSDPTGDPFHAHAATFGIRKIEIRDAQLLLNGEPIRMGGANRPSDHPRHGLVEPDELVHADLRLMKEAGMQLSRINHHASPVNLLDWSDRNGVLHVPEAGNWQLAPEQMDDPLMREKFQRQMREMVERDWNHPSVIGWSVGNEYAADSPAGVRWTRDMADYVRSLDDSRFVTAVTLGSTLDPTEVAREDRTFHYVDLIAVNMYGTPNGEGLERVHALWPEKPVFITEFGIRADQAGPERQDEYFRDFMQTIRRYPFVANASVWTFNDYRSRYPGTNPDGTRHWGVVDFGRQPRPTYHILREEFAPIVISGKATRQGGAVQSHIRITGRDDFPRYTLRNYTVVLRLLDASDRVIHEEARDIEELRPGQTVEISFGKSVDYDVGADRVHVDVVQPTGFSILDHTIMVAR